MTHNTGQLSKLFSLPVSSAVKYHQSGQAQHPVSQQHTMPTFSQSPCGDHPVLHIECKTSII
jgi:hypothetical protein